MSKVTGSYESIIRGVSQQVPQDRFVGQHWAQDNMVSDPVRGLARRHGSRLMGEKPMASITANAATIADLANYKEFSFTINSVDYSLMYRPVAKPSGSTMPPLICIRKSDGVILDVLTAAADTANVIAQLDGGVSAVGNVAKYLLLAPNNRAPDATVVDKVEVTGVADWSAFWIRQGAYSRTYTIKATTTAGVVYTASYTTPSSYYPGTLNTSDIPATATDYQKQVNDRVYAYQTAVNQWIGTSAAAIQPQNIALQLGDRLVAAGYSPSVGGVGVNGSHIVVTNAKAVEVDDGGDGTFMKGVAREVQSAADLCPIHATDKYVRIRPKGDSGSGVYYVKSVAKDGNNGPLGTWKEVIWTEAPGVLQTPGFVVMLGEIIGNNLYVATSQGHLANVSGDTNQTNWSASVAGDLDSQPIPSFFNKRITHISTFQDRLMLVSDSTINLSRSGDYFNFYRKSALTVADDDPVEIFALGSEGDVITDATMIDRSLILFGGQYQYAMDGRQALTPRTAFVSIQSAHEDATGCPPVAGGNYIFFSQQRNQRLTIQQMQTGDYADSFRAFDITTQLDGYLSGTPRQILSLTSPSWLVVRTKELTNGFHVFNYLDSADQSQRLVDSWSRWTFNPVLGKLVGLTTHNGNILALTLRTASDGQRLVLDQFFREADLSDYPYIDSIRDFENNASIKPGWPGEAESAVVFHAGGGDKFLLGQPLADYQKLFDAAPEVPVSYAMMGTLYESSMEPTAPYMRDSKDKAVLDSRLTLTAFQITLSESAALRAYLRGYSDPVSAESRIVDWIYRPAGTWVLNTQQVAPVVTLPVHVLREIREFRLRIASRNWLPMTLTSIEWSGQFFTQRRM
ncbi:tail protein [Pseudomonas phage vB_PpuP-Kurepalu-1]